MGCFLLIIFTKITKASKTTQPKAEANRTTGSKSVLVEGTIFITSTIIFALFHITICLILFPKVCVFINLCILFLIPQVIMLIALFEISVVLVIMSVWRASIVYFK